MANETNFYTYRDLNFFKRVNQIGNLERELPMAVRKISEKVQENTK